jgi:hypothetical protein
VALFLPVFAGIKAAKAPRKPGFLTRMLPAWRFKAKAWCGNMLVSRKEFWGRLRALQG